MGPEAGWQAEGYGYKKPTWVVSFVIPLSQKTVFFPLLLLPLKGEKSMISIKENESKFVNAESLYTTTFSYDQDEYVVSFSENGSPTVRCNGVTV